MTSATPAQSIGKWNDILPANIAKKINNSSVTSITYTSLGASDVHTEAHYSKNMRL